MSEEDLMASEKLGLLQVKYFSKIIFIPEFNVSHSLHLVPTINGVSTVPTNYKLS